MAAESSAVVDLMDRSKSLAKCRLRLIHAKVRSTIHRLGWTTKPVWISEFADKLDCDGGGVPDAIAVASAIGIGSLDEWVPLARLLKQGHRAVTVLNVCSMNQQFERTAIGVDHGVALAAHDLLACIIAERPACLDGLHALAADDRRRWCWLSSCSDAVDLNEMMIEAFKHTIVTHRAEPSVTCAPWPKTVGQRPPRASGP